MYPSTVLGLYTWNDIELNIKTKDQFWPKHKTKQWKKILYFNRNVHGILPVAWLWRVIYFKWLKLVLFLSLLTLTISISKSTVKKVTYWSDLLLSEYSALFPLWSNKRYGPRVQDTIWRKYKIIYDHFSAKMDLPWKNFKKGVFCRNLFYTLIRGSKPSLRVKFESMIGLDINTKHTHLQTLARQDKERQGEETCSMPGRLLYWLFGDMPCRLPESWLLNIQSDMPRRLSWIFTSALDWPWTDWAWSPSLSVLLELGALAFVCPSTPSAERKEDNNVASEIILVIIKSVWVSLSDETGCSSEGAEGLSSADDITVWGGDVLHWKTRSVTNKPELSKKTFFPPFELK